MGICSRQRVVRDNRVRDRGWTEALIIKNNGVQAETTKMKNLVYNAYIMYNVQYNAQEIFFSAHEPRADLSQRKQQGLLCFYSQHLCTFQCLSLACRFWNSSLQTAWLMTKNSHNIAVWLYKISLTWQLHPAIDKILLCADISRSAKLGRSHCTILWKCMAEYKLSNLRLAHKTIEH